MGFCSELWQSNTVLYQATLELPFNQELAKGRLDRSRFCHYLIQDAHYLVAFGRSLAIAAAKAADEAQVIQFADAAKGAVFEERSLHDSFLKEYGISSQQLATTPLSPACHHYTSYLLATAWAEPYPVVLAVLLPCFWIYAEVGREIHRMATRPNPYEAWIETYAGEPFHEAVREVIATVDQVAEQSAATTLVAMHQAYRHSAKLEWMFWDAAYRQLDWPV